MQQERAVKQKNPNLAEESYKVRGNQKHFFQKQIK